jgi:uncharacterized damage-inducible protein DinB
MSRNWEILHMPSKATARETEILLELLDQGYNRRAWHGPNLRGSFRGLSAAQAVWRPGPGRKNIAENVLHAAYWKYVARRRMTGDKKGSFALKGSNWFTVDEPFYELQWSEYSRLLAAEHEALRTAVEALPPSRWKEIPAGSKVSNSTLIQGIAAHDIYHAGQIQLLKRLQSDSEQFSFSDRSTDPTNPFF